MTDGNSAEHLSVAMTTNSVSDVTDTTAVDAETSSSRGIEFYFQCAVVVIGVVGTAANALILYALVASKQQKKQVLIFHQNALDFLSSLLLIVTYALKLCNFHLTGSSGYWFCTLMLSENIVWIVMMSSKANLVFITIERYLKGVYPIWSKKRLRKWIIQLAMVFAWISGFANVVPLTYITTDVIDGVCYAYVMWKSRASQLAYGIWYFVSYYVIMLSVFIFCYWRILVAIRRQASVIAGHGGGSGLTAAQTQIQSNVIKTMILVSAFFAVTELPMQVFYLLVNVHANLTLLDSGYYASMFISFLFFCGNPFIYATKFDPVKQVLLRLIPWKKNSVQPIETVEFSAACRAVQTTGHH